MFAIVLPGLPGAELVERSSRQPATRFHSWTDRFGNMTLQWAIYPKLFLLGSESKYHYLPSLSRRTQFRLQK